MGFVSFGLYLVSNKTCKNKTLVSPCQKRLHIPLSNLTGDVRRRAKISSTCHANFLWKLVHMQVKKKLSIWSFMLCADSTPSGILPTCTYCGQNGLGKFSVVNTCLVPIHVIHPSMLVALAPTKLLREQVAETG